jgi:hypothetical protein
VGRDAADRGRAKGISLGVAGLAVLLALVDFVLLRGEPVARDTARLNGASPAVFNVARLGEPHLLEIRTQRRVSGEDRGRKVSWRLVDPDGITIRDDEELLDHTERRFRFVPDQAGEYSVYVEDNGLLLRSETGSAFVTVRVNDRRILPRVFGFRL